MARIATACAYLFVLLLAYNAAELTWRIFAPAPDRESAPAAVKDTASAVTQTKPDGFARTIAGLHLLGNADTPATGQAPVVRETRLNLVLRGVIATHSKNARAIIYSPSGSERGEKPYSVNAKLPGGATLKEIHSDHIILLHNGRHETLRLPKKVIATTSAGHKISSQSNNRSSSRPSSVYSAQKIREYRDALVNDPVSLIGLIRSAPYKEDGKLVGYRVQTGRDKDALNDLGLIPGDIVTSVNGVDMSNSTQLMKLLKQLSKAEEVSAEVIRDGSPTTVTIRLDN